MHIKRKVGAAADLRRHLQNFYAPAREAADLGVTLDAAHDVLVGIGRRHGRIDIDAGGAVQIGVVVALQPADQIGRQEGINLRRGRFDDEVAEARQGHAGRTALVDHGSDAGPHADHIRIKPEAAGDILIDMRVSIDQAGQNQFAGDVDHLCLRLTAGWFSATAADPAAAHGKVVDTVDLRRRTNNAAAAQQEIIFLKFSHGAVSLFDAMPAF